MALTNAFYENVEAGNVRRVRIMMKDSLLVDPTFEEFDAMEEAAASMPGLYDEHDGQKFVEDRTQWNDEYMHKVMAKVVPNFSHERLAHLKEVVRRLRPVDRLASPKSGGSGKQNTRSSIPRSSYQEEKRRDQEKGDYLGRGWKIAGGALAGAVAEGAAIAVGGIVGGAVASTVDGLLVGAAVGGILVGAAAGAGIVASNI